MLLLHIPSVVLVFTLGIGQNVIRSKAKPWLILAVLIQLGYMVIM